jgi:hypothetical protein
MTRDNQRIQSKPVQAISVAGPIPSWAHRDRESTALSCIRQNRALRAATIGA